MKENSTVGKSMGDRIKEILLQFGIILFTNLHQAFYLLPRHHFSKCFMEFFFSYQILKIEQVIYVHKLSMII